MKNEGNTEGMSVEDWVWEQNGVRHTRASLPDTMLFQILTFRISPNNGQCVPIFACLFICSFVSHRFRITSLNLCICIFQKLLHAWNDGGSVRNNEDWTSRKWEIKCSPPDAGELVPATTIHWNPSTNMPTMSASTTTDLQRRINHTGHLPIWVGESLHFG